jgi:hypothetical protein
MPLAFARAIPALVRSLTFCASNFANDLLAAKPIPDGAAEERTGRSRRKEDEQINLGRLGGQIEAVHEIENVVAGDARQIEEFGEDQGNQHGNRPPHL